MEEEQIIETIQVTGKYPCRKCLLREMDKNAYMENLYAYIDRIEEDEGLCGACGCFVELRAVIAVNRCPYEKW